MSRLDRDQQTSNPATKWLEWSGKKENGFFKFYDKEAKEDVPVKKIKFMVLDQLNSIRGYHKKEKLSIKSNQVRFLDKEELDVRTIKNDPVKKGLYQDIKDHVSNAGGKFSKDVYAAVESKDGYVVVCITMYGAALGAWFDFCSQHKGTDSVEYGAVEFAGKTKKEKNGDNEYLIPVFKKVEVSEEDDQAAIELTKALEEYLKAQDLKIDEPSYNSGEYSHTADDEPKEHADIMEYEAERQKERAAHQQAAQTGEMPPQEEDDSDLPF